MFEPLTQIAYIPDHADGIDHPDVEFGFVTESPPNSEYSFCRYWSKFEKDELRTKSCGESTPNRCLTVYRSYDPAFVKKTYEKYK